MGKKILISLLAIFLLGLFSLPLISNSNYKNKPESQELLVNNHIVKEGETLTELAEIYYKNPEFWTNIWNDNPQIINPSILEPGDTVKIETKIPSVVEEIEKTLMDRLLNNSAKDEIDPDLAFSGAGIEKTTSVPSATPLNMPTFVITPLPQTQEASGIAFEEVYKQAGEKYGVPWQILYGLHLTETGQRDGAIFNGQGSGAQGPMQFMPGTWKAYGVDGNGDGVADINNAIDAIHGAANYLTKHGSIEQGLNYYGGNTSGTLAAACEKGLCL